MIEIYKSFIKELKSGKVKNLCLLHGWESYLLDKGLEEMKNKTVTGFAEMNYSLFDDQNLDIDKLQGSCETLPFGSEKKLIVVKDFYGLKSKQNKGSTDGGKKKEDISFINDLKEDVVLLFISFGDIDKRKKLYKDIVKSGSIFEFNKVNKADLRQWIEKYFVRVNKTIGDSEIEFLIQISGYYDKAENVNLYNMQNDMDKLVSYAGDNNIIDIDSIKSVIKEPAENSIFRLIDSCLSSDIPKCLKIYSDLLFEGESHYSVLGLLTWGIKNLIKIKELNEEGLDIGRISKELKIKEFMVRKNFNHCNKVTFNGLKSALDKCVKCETDMKSGKYTEKSTERISMELLLSTLFY